MPNLFRRIPIYVKVGMNEIEVTSLDTGETKSRTAIEKFSLQRLVIANFNPAEELLRDLLKEFDFYRKIFPPSYKMVMQQKIILDGGLSRVEYRALMDLAVMGGGAVVKVIEHAAPLTIEAALDALNSAIDL